MTEQTIRFVRPRMARYQIDFMDDPARFVVVEAATKTGKTTACMFWLLERALVRSDVIVWWVAPVYSQARIAYERLNTILTRINNQAAKAGVDLAFPVTKAPMQIHLPNGSRIDFISSDNYNALYGQDVHAVVVDEATRCREDAWHAVRSTLTATGGPARIIGNVRGRKNWVHKLAQKDYVSYHKITAYDAVDAGILDRSEIEQAKEDLPEHIFRELYLAEPSDDGGNPFGVQNVEAAAATYSLPAGEAAYFGIDLAKSQDYTAVVGLDKWNKVVYFERWQSDWQLTINTLSRLVARTPAYIDSTGVGDPIFENLQRACPNLHGYKYSQTSKQQLMLLLASDFHAHQITVPARTALYDELLMFEYQATTTGRISYSAPPGMHDDCVNALALACRAREDLRPRQSALLYPRLK